MQSLCTLRTPRCRDARNTHYQAARYALPGREVHPLDRARFAWRTVSGPRVRTGRSRGLSFLPPRHRLGGADQPALQGFDGGLLVIEADQAAGSAVDVIARPARAQG